jgi:hypothetical protein
VGLGGLAGFGPVHPLPGIAPHLVLNTAITLPIGVEAYGAYALGAWLTPGTPLRATTFARRSAIGALLLGMVGQVAYHLLNAAHATSAPWPVTVLVSCMPVVTLGFGGALTHLLRAPQEWGSEGAREPLPAMGAQPTSEPSLPVASEPPGPLPANPLRTPLPKAASEGAAKGPPLNGKAMTAAEVAEYARDHLGAVPVPSINAIMALAKADFEPGIARPKAKAAHDLLESSRITRAK